MTRWSKLGTSFAGVSVDTLLEAVEPLPEASHVVAFCYGGYTTNLPLDDLRGGEAWVVWSTRRAPAGRARRPGAAARAPPVLVEERQVAGRPAPARPRRARLLGELGYHNHGDPWREERYWGD